MTTEIAWHVELAVKPGQLEAFQALTREMVEATRDEPGALIYERFVSVDGTVVYGYERMRTPPRRWPTSWRSGTSTATGLSPRSSANGFWYSGSPVLNFKTS